MCSVGDDNLDEIKYMLEKTKLPLSGNCNKCREEPPVVVLRSKDKYCKECFLAGAVHKFKSLLGKTKLIRPNDRVLVVHKCGHPSTALLHLIRSGLDLATHKKLRFAPLILFVENNFHLTVEERLKAALEVEEETKKFGFECYFTTIRGKLSKTAKLLELENDDRDLVTKQTNESNRNDFFTIKLRNLVIETAKNLKCPFVFTPEISQDVSAQLLVDISLGRGSHIPLDTGFCDSRDPDVKILRPLRLFDHKELVFYNHFNSLEPVSLSPPKQNPYSSIQNLMMKFVCDLQANYPATVTTVLKTGDKLAIDPKLTKICEFCKAPVERDASELSAAESTQFSHWVSTQTPQDCSPQERYMKISNSFNNLPNHNYCYSCNKLVQ